MRAMCFLCVALRCYAFFVVWELDMAYNYSYSETKWNENYERAKKYYNENGTLYVPVSYVCDDGFKLGNWMARQRKHYKKGVLCQHRIELLEQIDVLWDVVSFSKNTSIPELIVFYYVKKYFNDAVKLCNSDFLKIEIDIYIPSKKVGIEYDGVYWHKSKSSIEKDKKKNLICLKNKIDLIRIRENGLIKLDDCYKNYFVEPDDKYELNSVIEQILTELKGMQIKCDINKDYKKILATKKEYANYRWNYIYSILEQKYRDNGFVEIKHREVDNSGINLYGWLCTQRQEFKKGLMTNSHKQKLEELGIVLDPYETEWNTYYNELIIYKNTYGTANVKIDYISKNGKALGRWVAHQREHYREGKLSARRVNKLEDLKFQFNPTKSDYTFKKELLLEYYKNNGNIDIPRGLYYKGINLFEYLQGVKKKYQKNKLSAEEIKFFNKLKIKWNKYEHQWEEAYEEAVLFYNENGHLIIPVKNTIKNGINLGVWVSTQRSDYKDNKLSADKIEKLNRIGMCWNTYDCKWKEKYNLLLDYYKEYGHINLKSNEEYKGVKLGMWLSSQRQAYRDNPNYAISSERIELLEALGINWTPRQKDKT